MQVKATYKDIWRISYPIMLGAMAQTLLGLTDTAFLARVGEVELGASAIAGVFYFVLVMLGMALSIGAQILMSRKAGENNRLEIGTIFDNSTIILFSLSIVLFTIMQFGAPWLFYKILKSHQVAEASVTFIKHRSYGIFFILLINCFRAFYTSITETKYITYNAIFMTVANIVFAYAFIFGKFGFEAQGIAGAGTASALAEALAFIFIALLTVYKKDIKSFQLFRFKNISKSLCRSIVQISTPIFFQNLLSMGAWFLFFVFIEQLGEHQLAISNLVRSSYMVLMTPIWGYSTAANSMVSNLIGQKKESEVMTLVKKIATLSLITTVCMFILNLFNFRILLNIMTSDMGIVEDSIPSYIIIWFGMFLFSLSMVGLSAVSGTGKTQVAMSIELVNIFIYIVYSYVTAVILHSQLEIVWGAEITYWLIMGLCAYYYLQTNKWKPVRESLTA